MKANDTLSEIEIHGHCEKRVSSANKAFADSFRSRGDVGAQFAATADGRLVIEIGAGYADGGRTHLWKRDSLACLYSTTKTMTALCSQILIDRGQLDLDVRVTRYWPEFAQAGEEDIPVKYLLRTISWPSLD